MFRFIHNQSDDGQYHEFEQLDMDGKLVVSTEHQTFRHGKIVEITAEIDNHAKLKHEAESAVGVFKN